MNLILATSLLCAPDSALESLEMDCTSSQIVHMYEMRLSERERAKIHEKCKFAIQKMYRRLDLAEREARQIKDINIRNITVGIIEGAIGGLSGRSPYTVIVGGCLGALARVSGDAYVHFRNSKDHLQDAEEYARIADDLQERLWRDR